jgi:hypothetical protein
MAARTAVVAGTATAVSGRVARRQRNRYAEQDAQYYGQQAAAVEQGYQEGGQQMAPPPPAPAPAPAAEDPAEQIQKLAQLHDPGALTDEEFAAAKAKVLGT